MPNWCENKLTLKPGSISDEDFEMLMKQLDDREDKSCFLKIIRPYEGEGDYDWCVENWGTKWDVDGEINNGFLLEFQNDGQVQLRFNTASCPPCAIYDFMTEMGIDVEAYWYVSGCGLYGEHTDGLDRDFDETEDKISILVNGLDYEPDDLHVLYHKYGSHIYRMVPASVRTIQALARGVLTRRKVHFALLSSDPDALARIM